MSKSGKKFDQGKLRFDLVPPECEEALVRVLTHGVGKYEANNWQQVEPFKDRYYAALRRHENAWRQGEIIDPETGLYHSAQMMCNAMFLLWRDIHESNDVRPDANRTSVVDSGTTEVDQQSLSNDNEATLSRNECLRVIAEVLDYLRAHQCIGAYSYRDLGNGGVEIIFSADNTPPSYVTHLK